MLFLKKLIIIPAFNEEHSILDLLEVLKKKSGYDIVVVNDCSTDNTEWISKNYCKTIKNMHVLSLPFNLGIGGTVQTGYLYALKNQYDIAIQMDGDGQHDPDYLGILTKPLESGEADMVIGSRFIEKQGFQSSKMRRLGIGFFSKLIKFLTGVSIKDTTSGYRAVNRKLICLFANDYPVDYPEPETNEKLLRMKYKVKEVPVIMKERTAGQSSISLMKSVWYMIKVSLSILIGHMKCSRRKQ